MFGGAVQVLHIHLSLRAVVVPWLLDTVARYLGEKNPSFAMEDVAEVSGSH